MDDDAAAARELHLALNGRSRRGCLNGRNAAAVPSDEQPQVAAVVRVPCRKRAARVVPLARPAKRGKNETNSCATERLQTTTNKKTRANNCEHGRQRSRCKECGGSGICQHGRRRRQCGGCALPYIGCTVESKLDGRKGEVVEFITRIRKYGIRYNNGTTKAITLTRLKEQLVKK